MVKLMASRLPHCLITYHAHGSYSEEVSWMLYASYYASTSIYCSAKTKPFMVVIPQIRYAACINIMKALEQNTLIQLVVAPYK